MSDAMHDKMLTEEMVQAFRAGLERVDAQRAKLEKVQRLRQRLGQLGLTERWLPDDGCDSD